MWKYAGSYFAILQVTIKIYNQIWGSHSLDVAKSHVRWILLLSCCLAEPWRQQVRITLINFNTLNLSEISTLIFNLSWTATCSTCLSPVPSEARRGCSPPRSSTGWAVIDDGLMVVCSIYVCKYTHNDAHAALDWLVSCWGLLLPLQSHIWHTHVCGVQTTIQKTISTHPASPYIEA